MSVLKRKSSLALIAGIIVMLLLIPLWYTMLVPSIIASEIEKIDTTTSFEGTLKGVACYMATGVYEVPISIRVHAYVDNVKADNVVLKVEVKMVRTDKNETLASPFSRNSTYVFNKFTRENVWGASGADKNRTGYDPLYPSHLKAGEDISNVWLDYLNISATLKFEESAVEEGVKLYKYSVNETIIVPDYYLPLDTYAIRANCTLTYAKTILIEPLSGLPAYIENETFSLVVNPRPPYSPEPMLLVYPLTYRSTAEAKAQGIADAKAAYYGIQLLELYIPSILGVVVIILIVGLAFNARRLERKSLFQS